MIQLYQIPHSPFCIVTRRILEFGRVPHKTINIPNSDRSLIWKITKQRYYQVPVIKDGRSVLFETDDESQVVAKYLDNKFKLGLFPSKLRGEQMILWRWIEGRVEGAAFKLNDIYHEDFVPKADRVGFIRHKERKFGRGCLQRWRQQQVELLHEFTEALLPFDQMLISRSYLLGDRPRFVDFDLYGMIGNFLSSGRYEFPVEHPRLNEWHQRMNRVKHDVSK